MTGRAIDGSRALWNRSRLDLESDEVLAQILDRGEMAPWRALYRQARHDSHLRARIHRIVLTVPLPLPRFWLAALADLGDEVDVGAAGDRERRCPAAALERQRTLIETQIEDLKARKPTMPEQQYAAELEKLLLQLARVTREIRARS